jgi:hypothetical protein
VFDTAHIEQRRLQRESISISIDSGCLHACIAPGFYYRTANRA